MITLSKDQFDELKNTLAAFERRLNTLNRAGVCPGVSDLLPLHTLNRLLDECYAEFERELAASFEEEHGASDPMPGEPDYGYNNCASAGKWK